MEVYLCWYPPSMSGSGSGKKEGSRKILDDKEQEAFWQAQGDRDGSWGPKASMSGLTRGLCLFPPPFGQTVLAERERKVSSRI
ncbi:hypothetical protein RvY_10944 [Ramazzottius varieornatus]|uniref:Uncharacterized protein n=1 Tax=Ramazzottius varieornatus TaxID=947166 RepID=A0A1D1VEF7_RAMVA|nr:hypothetical protein RvY_10944 [Ramazzottius varieornatus]